MSQSLIEKIRRARESTVSAGGLKFTVRRPTDLEMLDIQRAGAVSQGDILARFVTGWEGVKELDLVPGGVGVPVAFDAALFAEWIADRPDLWAPLTNAVVDSYKQHEARLAEESKNVLPG